MRRYKLNYSTLQRVQSCPVRPIPYTKSNLSQYTLTLAGNKEGLVVAQKIQAHPRPRYSAAYLLHSHIYRTQKATWPENSFPHGVAVR